jgi:hypothetical protein
MASSSDSVGSTEAKRLRIAVLQSVVIFCFKVVQHLPVGSKKYLFITGVSNWVHYCQNESKNK